MSVRSKRKLWLNTHPEYFETAEEGAERDGELDFQFYLESFDGKKSIADCLFFSFFSFFFWFSIPLFDFIHLPPKRRKRTFTPHSIPTQLTSSPPPAIQLPFNTIL